MTTSETEPRYLNFDLKLSNYQADRDSVDVLVEHYAAFVNGKVVTLDGSRKPCTKKLPPRVREYQAALAYQPLSSDDLRTFGRDLAEVILPEACEKGDSVRDLYLLALGATTATGKKLRIRLKIDEALADIPWEYVYLDDALTANDFRGFLARNPRISIVRYEILSGIPVPSPLSENESIRLVVLMPNPEKSETYARLNLAAEQANMRKALGTLNGLQVTYFPELNTTETAGNYVTSTVLMDQLQKDPHVLHFAGHGYFRKKMSRAVATVAGEGGLVLVKDDGAEDLMPSSKLEEMLADRKLRLVVLVSCETARRDQINAWSGVAPALARAEIPAIIAMQYSITDASAIAFSAALYASLAESNTLDDAMREGRKAIVFGAKVDEAYREVEWGIPTLYLRGEGDLVLFPRKVQSSLKQEDIRIVSNNTPTKLNLSADQITKLKILMQQCTCFLSDDSLRAIFSLRPTLLPYKLKVRSAPDPIQRIDLFLDSFLTKNIKGGKPVVLEFLEAVRDTLDGDELQDEIQSFLNSI